MVQKDLFGGAIVAEFKSGVVDVSDLRQVPDTQEVFVYPDSEASIIVEILQRVPAQSDEDAVKFHFDALAHDNDAVSSAIQAPVVVPNVRGDQTPSHILLRGSQRVHKFNAIVPDDVDIFMALFRINSGGKSADVVVSANIPGSSESEERAAAIASDFHALVSSLRIVDYDLFC